MWCSINILQGCAIIKLLISGNGYMYDIGARKSTLGSNVDILCTLQECWRHFKVVESYWSKYLKA